MFDFFVHISKEQCPSEIRFDVISTDEYLENINYKEKLFKGKNFSLSALIHDDANTSFHYADNGIHVFLMGNVYTTKVYATNNNTKPKRINPSGILQFYKEQGESFVANLKGTFTILILDEANELYRIYSSRAALNDTLYFEGPDFIIASTSLEAILKFQGTSHEIDPISVIQHSIFDYPLGEKTLFSTVKILPQANYLTYNLQTSISAKYFDYLSLLKQPDQISWKETYQQTAVQFNDAIDLLIEGKEKLCASLTSGFDSRTNLSRLFNSGKDILYYSWGMRGSVEITIPQLIAKKIGINYEPIFLEKEFEDSYSYFGKQAIMWSGGKGTIRRANHTYGYSKLFSHSHSIITGLFGSELLRPANAVGHIFNQAFIDVIYSDNQHLKLLELFEKEQTKGFLQPEMLEKYKTEFLKITEDYFSELSKAGEKYLQIYYFSLKEGFRKYFGHEIQGCRQYVEILSPYIDDDFVAFILQTPIPALNKFAFKRNPRSLKLGQSFYLPIIEKNFSKLMKIPTGRFYSPAQLQSVFYPLSILPGYIKHMRRRKGNDTFDTQRWNNIFLKQNPETYNYFDEFFSCMNNINYKESNNINDLPKQLSLRFWLMNCLQASDAK